MRPNYNSDKKLSLSIKSADQAAFKQVFLRYQARIFRFLCSKLYDSETAEDLLQEVFIRLWENRRNIDENLSLKAYLFTIDNNLALNHIRHQNVVLNHRKQQVAAGNFDLETPSPQMVLESREFDVQLHAAIEGLPEKNRIIFMMSRFDGLSYKEIAEKLNISVKTVESHIGKSLKRLAAALQAVESLS